MAKPIRATPELKGEDADKFLRKMILVEKSPITNQDKELVRQIESNSQFFKVIY